MQKLVTRWGSSLDKDNIQKEYPRPRLVRDSYLNLNGEWEYEISKSNRTKEYTGKILVPFSPEAPLSGVEKIVMPGDYLHYRKSFSLPEGFCKDKVILHFGAVDQECRVCLNGQEIGSHKGGYLPFHFEVSDMIFDEANVLTLCVTDKTEASPHARGKQKLVKKGKFGALFYTPNSGIWKTVWMESTVEEYVQDLRITPLFDESSVRFHVVTNGICPTARLCIKAEGFSVKEARIPVNKDADIFLENFLSWTPQAPYLYEVEIGYGNDRVRSYFGMRKFSAQRDPHGILRFYLNNNPFFFSGVLDQGYWPDGLLTAPSDDALLYDITKMKELGFNTIRKHIKIESERFYYHCDRIGMAVWQDMPNGGGDYNMLFVTHLPNAFDWFARGVRDHFYALFKRKDREGREQYYRDLEGMIRHLRHYPSIAVWIPFNEGWGQFDASKATNRVRAIDDTRLINEACGWFDQKGGDIYSIHNYSGKLRVTPQADRVVALTEFGGYAYPVKGHTAFEASFGYQHFSTSEQLTANYLKLVEQEILLNLENGLSSAIYTQLSDVEAEVNGMMTYDRAVDKMLSNEVRKENEKLLKRFGYVTGE